MAGAGERTVTVVGGTHIAAEVGSAGSGAGSGVGLGSRGAVRESGARNGVVVETRNVPELEREIDGGLAIGRIEAAVFGRVLIQIHLDVEGFFDGRDGRGEANIHGIARAAGHREAAGFRELDERVIVFLAGAEALGEFFYGDEVVIVDAVAIGRRPEGSSEVRERGEGRGRYRSA